MDKYFYGRNIVEEANYIVENGVTVRTAAKVFGISKSVLHVDVTKRLVQIDKELAAKVKKVLDKNKAEWHVRGGRAVHEKRRKFEGKGKIEK